MAVWAYDYDHRVNGVFLTGYGTTGTFSIAKARMRMINGNGDTGNTDRTTLNTITGRSCGSAVYNCLDSSAGNGWFLVRTSDLDSGASADHCWFDRRSCNSKTIRLDANWSSGTAAFSLAATADWLASLAPP